jgi:putative serine protease PepD
MVSAGIIIGDSLNDEPVATETVPTPIADRPVSSGDDTSSSILPADPVGPLTGEESDEPVADVADAVSPSVVLIRTSDGQGSGIVWDAEEGYILTNDHVTGDASAVVVQFGDGNRISGTVIGGDSARDIAVVQVDPTEADLVQAVFAPTETVQVGQLAVAIGSPFGLDQSVTAGIVSAVNRINNFGGSDPTNPVDVEMIQTDAPINPGNSGGALADRDGRVIGMNTQIRTAGNDDIGNIGIGFAVPSDTIVLIAQRIVDGESLDLAHLGVSGATPTDGTVGALVQSVVSDAPADNAGLQAGDLIVSLGGELISSMAELSAEVKLFRPGDLVQVELLRDGERLETTVTLGSN